MRLLLLVLAAACVTIVEVRAQGAMPEYDLKAAFVTKFPQFAEWPDEALERDTIDICVARPSPFGTVLHDLTQGETINGRRLAVREIGAVDASAGCHVLFVPGDASGGRRSYLENTKALPVLTIGDHPRFLQEGGIVYLRIVEGRVRFEINAEAARRARLRLSSQLLRIALRVHGPLS